MIPRLENYKTRPSVDRRIFHETIDRDRSSSKSRLNLDSDMYAFTGINIVTSIYTLYMHLPQNRIELSPRCDNTSGAFFPASSSFSFFQIFSLFSLTRAMTSCRFFLIFGVSFFLFPMNFSPLCLLWSSFSSLIILFLPFHLSPFFSSPYDKSIFHLIIFFTFPFSFFLKYLLPSLISPRDILPAFLFNSSIYI